MSILSRMKSGLSNAGSTAKQNFRPNNTAEEICMYAAPPIYVAGKATAAGFSALRNRRRQNSQGGDNNESQQAS